MNDERAVDTAASVEADTGPYEADMRRAETDATRRAAGVARNESDAEPGEAIRLRAELAAALDEVASARAEAEAARHAAGVARGELARALGMANGERAEVDALHSQAASLQHTRRGLQQRLHGLARAALRRIGGVPGVLRAWRVLRPNPLFDPAWYLEEYTDVRERGAQPYRHYRRHGVAEGRDPNPFFDTDWYLSQNPDVRSSGMDPLDHYLRFGGNEGRDPSPLFASDWYNRENPDVRESGMNPLLHYLRHGRDEGRRPRLQAGAVAARSVAGADPAPRAPMQDTRLLRKLVERAVPAGAQVAVMNGGERIFVDVPGFDVVRLSNDVQRDRTSDASGVTSAIGQLETLRATGLEFLIVSSTHPTGSPAGPSLRSHVESRYRAVGRNAVGVAYDLRKSIGVEDTRANAILAGVAETFRERFDREPVILDANTRSNLAEAVPSSQVFKPPTAETRRLPYLDHSVDIVAVRAGDPDAIAEAKRVADAAVIALSGDGPNATATLQWQRDGARPTRPSVSIIVPTYAGGKLLECCLRTLGETLAPDTDTEIVVVDDASPSEARVAAIAAGRPGVALLRNDRNLGFLGSANRGASVAKGDILVFLNDDTIMLPGWLPALLRTFRAHRDAGVVGGRLLHPDGSLQEAGGLIFSDGSAAKFGYAERDADAPVFLYVRSVDYVSGALLATPRTRFLELGGFDSAYGFGYYEDVDYCFKIREVGLSVYYQPDSVIVHLEGGTAGTDLAVGPKRNQVKNADLFRERWGHRLTDQPVRPALFDMHTWLSLRDAPTALPPEAP